MVLLTIRLSVVVACDRAERTIAATLESIGAACNGIPHEILVVHRADKNVAAVLGGSRHVVRTVQAAPDDAVPMLWARGIAVARGEVIALTTGHFRMSESWAHALLAEIGGGVVGASGPILFASGTGIIARAIYFLRYSPVMNPPDGTTMGEIPGDNAAYTRAALERHADSFARGFWEVDFHRRVRAEGERLAFTKGAEVVVGTSFDFGDFLRQRFRHGRHFGAYRVAVLGAPRWRGVVAAPLVPLVLTARILRRALGTPRAVLPALTSLPALVPFTIAWAAGEAIGALTGSTDHTT